MQIERLRPSIFRMTLHAYDLATLISSARWVAEGAHGELPVEARSQLEDVLRRYDAAYKRVGGNSDEGVNTEGS